MTGVPARRPTMSRARRPSRARRLQGSPLGAASSSPAVPRKARPTGVTVIVHPVAMATSSRSGRPPVTLRERWQPVLLSDILHSIASAVNPVVSSGAGGALRPFSGRGRAVPIRALALSSRAYPHGPAPRPKRVDPVKSTPTILDMWKFLNATRGSYSSSCGDSGISMASQRPGSSAPANCDDGKIKTYPGDQVIPGGSSGVISREPGPGGECWAGREVHQPARYIIRRKLGLIRSHIDKDDAHVKRAFVDGRRRPGRDRAGMGGNGVGAVRGVLASGADPA
jgi:hypothetical protein